MNSLQDLLEHGIDEHTAMSMLQNYKNRIGTMNGVYEIVDINYDFSVKGKDVALKCSECGKIIHRTMINGRNKWSELIKSCNCQKERKRRELENFEKIKKELILAENGNVYGDYVVTGVQFGNPDKLIMNCMECGAEIRVPHYMISAGRWKNQKCHKHYIASPEYDESFIGQKNYFLTVTGITRDKFNKKVLVCRCDCGNVKKIQPYHWKSGIVKSCGCKHDMLVTKHGLSGERLYRIWNGMNQRCYCKNHIAYDSYGGRGIKICDEWLGDTGLLNFYNWAVMHGYSDDLSIDRINVNGNYEPDNCRWATPEEQANNKRPSCEWKKRKNIKRNKRVYWDVNGVIKPALDWCKEYQISYASASYRIKSKGMTPYEALTATKLTEGRPRKVM